MKKTVRYIGLSGLLLSLALTAGATTPYQQERAVYQQAVKAIQQDNAAFYPQARRLLADYPLLPYLEYDYLVNRFADLPERQISLFLQRYPDTYIARKLHVRWLNYLGHYRQWQLFDRFYQADQATDTHQCYHFESQLASGSNKQAVYARIGLHWLKPYSLPKSCDRLLGLWQAQGYPDHALAWRRFQAGFANNNHSLARYLVRYLSDDGKATASRLLNASRHAEYWLETLAQGQTHQLSSTSLKRLLRTLAGRHYQAVAALIKAQPQMLEADDLLEIQQLTAWHLANKSEGVNQWLSDINAHDQPGLTEYQLRYAMQAHNWLLYQRLFNQLSERVSDNDEWLYWYAMAQQKSGLLDDNPYYRPQNIFRRLAERRSFYGFLAAEKQQLDVAIEAAPGIIEEPASDRLVDKKLALALELYRIGELTDASREWYYATRSFNRQQWQQAGRIAHQAQWHDRTIQAFARAGQWHAIDRRFPLAYQELFYQHSRKNALDQGWLLAMARQESGFAARARSAVGAIGVLQLMPDTARRLAHDMQKNFDSNKLFEPAYNIALGSRYLKQMLERFDNNYILATAAYNAGPNKVSEWLEKRPMTEDWVHWVATIPYPETRDYVKNILTYSRIYQSRLGPENIQLSLLQPQG